MRFDCAGSGSVSPLAIVARVLSSSETDLVAVLDLPTTTFLYRFSGQAGGDLRRGKHRQWD